MGVYAKQYGRLGNRCFQQAAAIGYAMTHDMPYVLGELTTNKVMRMSPVITLKEGGHNYTELPFQSHWKNKAVILDGYWQSEKYFAHCREEVLKAFVFPWELKEGWCSIHVRRGDYLNYPDKHPVVTAEYLEKAMDYMIGKLGYYQFMFFSDDIDWCKYFVKHGEFAAEFISEFREGYTEIEDLIVMSCCESHIISNSTFSWWGAWLNQNPNKVVISPSKDNWFGPGNAHLDTSDLIPESWIQIKY